MVGNNRAVHRPAEERHYSTVNGLPAKNIRPPRNDRCGNAGHCKRAEARGDGGQEAVPMDRQSNQGRLQSFGEEAMGSVGHPRELSSVKNVYRSLGSNSVVDNSIVCVTQFTVFAARSKLDSRENGLHRANVGRIRMDSKPDRSGWVFDSADHTGFDKFGYC